MVGIFVEGFDWLTGMSVHETAQPIFENLEAKGSSTAWRTIPTATRSAGAARRNWSFAWWTSGSSAWASSSTSPTRQVTDEEKDSRLRYQIMESVQETRWIPAFGLEREMDWLRNMHDWMISKKRYWGLALPIWECEECGWFDVIGSEEELQGAGRRGLGGVRGTPAPPALRGCRQDPLRGVRRHRQPHPRRGQSLAGCRHRRLFHAAVPHRPGVLAASGSRPT